MNKSCSKCGNMIAGRGSTGMCRACVSRAHWANSEYREKVVRLAREALYRPEVNERLRSRVFTIEHRLKLSLSHAGPGNGFYGKRHSLETRARISASTKGQHAGSRNHNWEGGIQPDPYSNTFTRFIKKQVRERDGFICQDCKKPEGERHHHVHHVSQNKQETRLDAFITLCPLCHAKYHPDRGHHYRKN